MSIHVGIGFSKESNTVSAAREAALQAKTKIKYPQIDLALVFATIHYNPLETLRVVRQTLSKAKIAGCSTAGILLSESIETQGIAVLGLSFEDVKFSLSHVPDLSGQNLSVAGTELAHTVSMDFGQEHRHALILLMDGLLKNNSQFIEGIQQILGRAFPIVGGGSSDSFNFQETFQFFQEQAFHHSAVGLLLGGHIKIGISSRHGFKPLGKPRFVTQANDEMIRKIDHQRASSIYEEYFDMDLEKLRALKLTHTAQLHPLGFYIEGENEYLLRNALEVLPDGSIICQGEVPQESEVHIMMADKDYCQQATQAAAKEVKEMLAGKSPQLLIVFESFARHKLFRRAGLQEIQTIKEVFDPATPLIGMYTYGEIAPLKSLSHMGKASLLNATLTLLAIA